MLAEGVELARRGRPHTHTPTAAVVAATTTGAVLAQAAAAATPAGYRQLLALAAQQWSWTGPSGPPARPWAATSSPSPGLGDITRRSRRG